MALSPAMQDALNQHLKTELESAYLYFSMDAYLNGANFSGAAHWMRLQAQEESTITETIHEIDLHPIA